MDEVVHIFGTWVENELYQASSGKKPEEATIFRQNKFNEIFGINKKLQHFGPKDQVELSENPYKPPPGTYADPAKLFSRSDK